MLVLSLVTSVALAGKTDPADKYADSLNGTVTSGVIKSLSNCPDGTDAFFKNVNPFISGGPGGNPGELRWDGTYPIDGSYVTLTVFWRDDNSFRFEVTNGVMQKIGAEVDSDKLIYVYAGPVNEDFNLNVLKSGSASEKVNHLDVCLAVADPGDIIDPEVMITSPTVGEVVTGEVTVLTVATDNAAVSSVTASVDGTAVNDTCQLVTGDQYACSLDTTGLTSGNYTITVVATDTSGNTGTSTVSVFLDNEAPDATINPPSDGDEVSGTVTVTATVIDNVAVNPGSVTASVYPVGDPSSAEDLGVGSPAGGDVYTWSWDTAPLLAGFYTIEVSATDTSDNTGTGSVTVEVLKLLTDCFGLLDDEDFPGGPDVDPYPNGCKPTALVNVQAPPYTEICNPDLATGPIPAFCYLSGGLLKPDPSKYADAAAKYGGCDACAAGYCGDYGLPDPRMYCDGTFNSQIGECTGEWKPRTPLQPLYVEDVAEGNPDLVLGKFVYGNKGCFAAAQHTRGGASIVDLYPFWPMDIGTTPENEATGAIFVKTDFPADVIPPGLVAQCDAGLLSAQTGYQPIGKMQSVDRLADGTPAVTLAGTENCVNPARKATRDNGYDVASIIETDGSDDLLTFKYQRAQEQFDGVFAALDCAGPTLLTGKLSDVTSPVNQAKAQFDNGTVAALERAIEDLEAAALAIKEETTWSMTPENCAGDALARIYNLTWRLTQLRDAQS